LADGVGPLVPHRLRRPEIFTFHPVVGIDDFMLARFAISPMSICHSVKFANRFLRYACVARFQPFSGIASSVALGMRSTMIRWTECLEIFRPIVEHISVFVMDMKAFRDRPEMMFVDDAVCVEIASIVQS
jgi:hypothetical protein